MNENNVNKWRYMCRNKKVGFVDPVTGKTRLFACEDARSIGGPCGKHACHFEANKTEAQLRDEQNRG